MLVACICGFIYLVDPYALHEQKRIDGFNAKKPFAYTHAALTKKRLASLANPRTIFLGNSRVDVGFNPLSTALPASAKPSFNFGIPGQSLASDYRNLTTTTNLEAVNYVIIGVDFADFPYSGQSHAQEKNKPGKQSSFMQMMRTNLSMTAFSDALITIVSQKSAFTNDMTKHGANTFRQHAGHVRLEGHFGLFHQRNIENARAYLHRPTQVRTEDGKLSPAFEYLDWLLDWCQQRDIQVHLVIYPYHAQLLELLYHSGHWPVYEEWKRLLVKVVENAGKKVSLWDFSGYHEVASEKVPEKGDTFSEMRWYWEAGHFKPALGDLMLMRIFGKKPDPDIGVQLTNTTVNTVIENIRQQRVRWRASYPDDARYVESLYHLLETTQR